MSLFDYVDTSFLPRSATSLFTNIFVLFFFLYSTKHHPDKPGGDVDTFRTLKRAQTVLSNPKLRQQYDILGLDLDDDEVEQNNASGAEDEDGGAEAQATSQGIVQDIASMALTTVLQLGVRTGTYFFKIDYGTSKIMATCFA